jgi:hypothetical protein
MLLDSFLLPRADLIRAVLLLLLKMENFFISVCREHLVQPSSGLLHIPEHNHPGHVRPIRRTRSNLRCSLTYDS